MKSKKYRPVDNVKEIKTWVWSLYAFSLIAGAAVRFGGDYWTRRAMVWGAVIGMAAIILAKRHIKFDIFLHSSAAGLVSGGAATMLAVALKAPKAWPVFTSLSLAGLIMTLLLVFVTIPRASRTPDVEPIVVPEFSDAAEAKAWFDNEMSQVDGRLAGMDQQQAVLGLVLAGVGLLLMVALLTGILELKTSSTVAALSVVLLVGGLFMSWGWISRKLLKKD